MINVKEHGVTGLGKVDDHPATQRLADKIVKETNRYKWSTGGDTLDMSNGHYRMDKPLEIKGPNIRIIGDSGLDYVGRHCWIDYRGEGAAIRLPKGDHRVNGFSIENILLIGRNKPGVHGIEISTGDKFRRKINIKAGIFNFDTGVKIVRNGGKMTQIGFLTLDESSIQLNRQALVFDYPTSVNGFSCRNADLSQNYKSKYVASAIDARIFGGVFDTCCFEGQNFAMNLHNSDAVRIVGNFYEGILHFALKIRKSTNITLEGNRCYREEDFKDKFQFEQCDRVTFNDPIGRLSESECTNVKVG